MTVSAAPVIPAQAGISPTRQGVRRVAVLGAQGTGKTQLSREIAAHLRACGMEHEVVVADGALEGQQTPDATLLCGLDLPWTGAPREPEDVALRASLQRASIPYQVVYGTGPQRLQSALIALAASGIVPAVERPQDDERRAWNWVCEKCSDPACEHRLFTQLREKRG